jgi:hypothetical protein
MRIPSPAAYYLLNQTVRDYGGVTAAPAGPEDVIGQAMLKIGGRWTIPGACGTRDSVADVVQR